MLILAAIFTGCSLTSSGPVLRPAKPAFYDFEVPEARDKVFDAALAVAQAMNINVAVLEKSSGLVRLEWATVAPAQLDEYCQFFEVVDETGEPVSTFTDANVSGVMSMTVLLSETSPAVTSVDLRSNWATQPVSRTSLFSTYPGLGVLQLESKATLENEFRRQLFARLNIAEKKT